MQGGFSFCGVDIAKFGLEYVPTLEDTYVYAAAKRNIHQEVFDAHHGGYFYGATVQPKDFTLRCVFQDKHITRGILSTIESFFRVGKTGKLVFEKRSWLWYTATIIEVDTTQLLNSSNGFVTISLRAYYPFARHDHIAIDEQNMLFPNLTTNSGLLPVSSTPSVQIGAFSSDKSFLLYNGGTEMANTAIYIAGDAGEGVTITNKTTGQVCKLRAFTSALTSNVNQCLVVDSLNGKTILTDGTTATPAFLYHDSGFIDLAPSFPIERNINVTTTEASNKIGVSDIAAHQNMIGKYICLSDTWYKIIGIDEGGNLIVDQNVSVTDTATAHIVTMNEIEVHLGAGASITKLDFNYKPTFQ